MQKIKQYILVHTVHCLQIMVFAWVLSAFTNSMDHNPPVSALIHTPQRVSLLLPLEGEWKGVGEAIQAGFMAAYKLADPKFTVSVINTQRKKNIQASYQEAIRQKADLVIGPLLKSDVYALSKYKTLTRPVLTLNYLDQHDDAPANFYQFGLSPLDEITQITQHAKDHAHQSALVLSPKNAWGGALTQSFIQQWEALGGTIAGCLHYSDNPAAINHSIRTFLDFQSPKKRRTDFDVIFLAANSKMARQINPLFAFYFAANIPVYATAHLYDQNIPSYLNRDLDPITLCDTPWSVGMSHIYPTIYAECQRQDPDYFAHYARYYALGVDAFQLTMNLVTLDQDENKMIQGASGDLFIHQDRRIIRKPVLGQFKQGIPQALSSYS